jgi:hypothetical protein
MKNIIYFNVKLKIVSIYLFIEIQIFRIIIIKITKIEITKVKI